MQYLVWWNPSTWLSDGLEMIAGGIQHALRSLFYLLDKFLYQLVIDLYNTFELLCTSRLLDSMLMNEISRRVGLLLGIVMIFMVVFSFIKILVDPDKLNDKKIGAISIVKKCLIVIVMLGTSQFVFEGLYKIQNAVLKENIISKLILPYTVDTNNFGALLSEQVFTSFYRVDNSLEDSTESAVVDCRDSIEKLKYGIYYYNNFESGYACLNETIVVTDEAELITEQEIMIIDYNWLLATGVAIVLIYFMLSYCISVGVRVIQLTVLEIIAPMAIISYVSPKDDNMFNKWSKIYIATYIDVFIRIAIISLVVFLISTILSDGDQWVFWQTVGNPTDFWTRSFIMIVMILALLVFAKKAPDLIKELLPASASKIGFGGVGFKDMLGGNYVKKGLTTGAKVATAGAAVGLVSAGISAASRFKANKNNGKTTREALMGAAGGFFTAMPRGLMAGAKKGNIFGNISKGLNAQRDIDDKYDELITGGGTPRGKLGAKISSYIGETAGQIYTRKIKNNEAVVKAYNDINNAADGMSEVKAAKSAWENAKARGESDTKIEEMRQKYKAVKKNYIDRALAGDTFKDAEDQSIAAAIQVQHADLDNLIRTNKVQLKDRDGNTIKTFNNYEDINNAAIVANTNIAEIKNSPDYNAAIANDKAAGVNSNASKK